MKENIHLIDEEQIEKILKEYNLEEEQARQLKTQYEEFYDNFQKNNKKREEILNHIRMSKVEEICELWNKYESRIEELHCKRKSILSNYCNKNGHKYTLVSPIRFGNSRISSVNCKPILLPRQNIGEDYFYRCCICGEKIKYEYLKRCRNKYTILKEEIKELPSDIYDDETLSENGKTLRMIEEEIEMIKEKMKYLKLLGGKICETFGHISAEKHFCSNYYYFRCKCCKEYLEEYEAKKIASNTLTINKINIDDTYSLSLPTYEDYQKTLKKEN